MYKNEKLGLLFILSLFTVFFVLTSQANEKIRMYPYFVCCIGFLLTAFKLGTTVYKEKHGIDVEVSAPLNKEQMFSVIITLVAAFAYAILARIVGYFTMTFVFVGGYSFWHTKTQKWWTYPAVALGMDIVIYVAFKVFLSIPLPSGWLI